MRLRTILPLTFLLASAAPVWANGASGPSPLEACNRAQAEMRRRLAAENTKLFQPCSEAEVVRSGDRWRVVTYVDTENILGQLTRLDFAAVFEYRPAAIPIWQLTCIGSCR